MAKAIKPTEEQYGIIVEKLCKAGFSVKTEKKQSKLFTALESSGFVVELDGVEYSVYAAKIIAMMHKGCAKKGKALKL